MINVHDILETIKMIDEEYLDVRTITMGISLLDCCDSNMHILWSAVHRRSALISSAVILPLFKRAVRQVTES